MADVENVISNLELNIRWICDNPAHQFPGYGNVEMAMRDALELLKEQQHWIPISERKPKSNGVYIVSRWVSDGCERLILADASYFDGTDTWYDDTKINYDAIYDSDRIVAWMPLPEPYRTDT